MSGSIIRVEYGKGYEADSEHKESKVKRKRLRRKRWIRVKGYRKDLARRASIRKRSKKVAVEDLFLLLPLLSLSEAK